MFISKLFIPEGILILKVETKCIDFCFNLKNICVYMKFNFYFTTDT